MAATIIVGMIAIDVRGARWKRALVASAFVGWVAFTRIGLGVHYPGDVVGGIGYALVFLGLLYAVRRVAEDDARAAFAIGLTFAVAAMLVSGSRNAHIALGGGLGALVTWQYAPLVANRVHKSVWEYLLPPIGVAIVIGTWFVTDLGIGNRLFIVGWSALFLSAVVLVPWVVPERDRWPVLSGQSSERYAKGD